MSQHGGRSSTGRETVLPRRQKPYLPCVLSSPRGEVALPCHRARATAQRQAARAPSPPSPAVARLLSCDAAHLFCPSARASVRSCALPAVDEARPSSSESTMITCTWLSAHSGCTSGAARAEAAQHTKRVTLAHTTTAMSLGVLYRPARVAGITSSSSPPSAAELVGFASASLPDSSQLLPLLSAKREPSRELSELILLLSGSSSSLLVPFPASGSCCALR